MFFTRLGPTILHLHARIRSRLYTQILRSGFSAFGKGSTIVPPLRFGGLDRIRVGSDVYLGTGSWIAARTTPSNESISTLIELGDHVTISGFCAITAVSGVVIEDSVLIARNLYVSDHSHRFTEVGVPVRDQGLNNIANVRICRGVWIGENVVVCPGVTIGKGAVIGANSVVRKDVPDYCVAAGAPARVIRRIQGGAKTRTEA